MVKVKLDKQRPLKYTNRALMRLEEETGLTLQELIDRAAKMSLFAINALVWAGINDPDVSLDDVADILPLKNLTDVVEAIGQAIEEALGPDAPKAGT